MVTGKAGIDPVMEGGGETTRWPARRHGPTRSAGDLQMISRSGARMDFTHRKKQFIGMEKERRAVAEFPVAFQWAMQFEDPLMACEPVPDAAPAGVAGPCHAISGINSGAWPAQFSAIAALPRSERKPAVETFYRGRYWNAWLAQIGSDDVAKRVFDFSVNAGSGTAVKTLQQALNALGGSLAVDGGWGPQTLAAANAADAAALVKAFIEARVAHYQAIAAADPADAAYLNGWLARAQS